MSNTCPVCQFPEPNVFLDLYKMPVMIGIQWETSELAKGCERGDMKLAYCPACGFIWNQIFDGNLMAYSQKYDNSLDFSPVFQTYSRGLAKYLLETYGIYDRDVVELGCGKGHFLSLLCELGDNRGVGFDPSYEGQRVSSSAAARITYVQDFYGENYTGHPADLICCRHVFEHIPDPVSFLASVRRTIGNSRETVVYFEVPNTRFILDNLSVWDIIYEHCNYFSRESLEIIFRREGFEVLKVEEIYGGQFLGLEARLAETPASISIPIDLSTIATSVSRFDEKMRARERSWMQRLEYYRKTRRAWQSGEGARKQLAFEYVANNNGGILCRRHQSAQTRTTPPGTGQLIVAPDFLAAYKPAFVILMNPIYANEVAEHLNQMGVTAELIGA